MTVRTCPQTPATSQIATRQSAARCPSTLADRLVAGLEAGARRYGDRRCSKSQTALSAVLEVAGPDDDPRRPALRIRVERQEPGRENPVALLRARYDGWRAENPPAPRACEAAPPR